MLSDRGTRAISTKAVRMSLLHHGDRALECRPRLTRRRGPGNHHGQEQLLTVVAFAAAAATLTPIPTAAQQEALALHAEGAEVTAVRVLRDGTFLALVHGPAALAAPVRDGRLPTTPPRPPPDWSATATRRSDACAAPPTSTSPPPTCWSRNWRGRPTESAAQHPDRRPAQHPAHRHTDRREPPRRHRTAAAPGLDPADPRPARATGERNPSGPLPSSALRCRRGQRVSATTGPPSRR